MRTLQTPSEEHAIAAVIESVRAEGLVVEQDPLISDRPDALLVVGGRRVGLECTAFTPERIMKLHGLKMPAGALFLLYLPLEPHIWLGNAIRAKTKKVEEYKRRGDASEVWLVVHSARGMFAHLAELYERGLADLFLIAAAQNSHGFERIYLTGEFDLPPVCIYSERSAAELQTRFGGKRVIEVPVARYQFGRALLVPGRDGFGNISGTLYQPGQKKILLQPLDRDFSVDYSCLASLPSEEVARRPDLGTLMAVARREHGRHV